MNAIKGKYTVILADPPWKYRDSANSGKRGAEHKYPVMTLDQLKRMPVADLANEESCVLFMWHVGPMPDEAKELTKAWGFRLMNMKGFTWIKTYKRKTDKFALGMGHTTRGNSEDCLVAVKGKIPKRLDAGISQVIIAPRLEHSAKPVEVRERIEKLFGDVPRLEMFARGEKPEGWDVFGNEAEGSIQYVPAFFAEEEN